VAGHLATWTVTGLAAFALYRVSVTAIPVLSHQAKLLLAAAIFLLWVCINCLGSSPCAWVIAGPRSTSSLTGDLAYPGRPGWVWRTDGIASAVVGL
jgi:hypothetical protein